MSYCKTLLENNIVIKHIKEQNDYAWDDLVREYEYYAIFEINEYGGENEIARSDTLKELFNKI